MIWIYTPAPSTVLPGRVLEGLGFKQYKWPGYGLEPDVLSYQYIEGEYMKADEYEALINDPSDFWMRVHVPRIFGPWNHSASFPPLPLLLKYHPAI